MGLLEKRNPRATRRSVILWATGIGIVSGLVGFAGWLRTDLPTGAVFIFVPWMTVFCAVAGGAMEWQLLLAPDEDARPFAPPSHSSNRTPTTTQRLMNP